MRFHLVINKQKTQKCLFNPIRRSFSSLVRGQDDDDKTHVDLSYSTYENKMTGGAPPVLVVHGLMACKRNYVALCKKIRDGTTPERKVLAIDLRNHGDSTQTLQHMNSQCIGDLRHFMNSHKIPSAALLGHSYGGVICMLMSVLYPDKIEKLIVEDMSPVHREGSMKPIQDAMDALFNLVLPSNIPMTKARSLAEPKLTKGIPDKGLRDFLLSQLVQKPNGQYSWIFNLPILRQNFAKLFNFSEMQGKTYDKPVIFVGAGNSAYLKKADEPEIIRYFPKAKFFYVEGSDHLIHVSKLQEFAKICNDFLNEQIK